MSYTCRENVIPWHVYWEAMLHYDDVIMTTIASQITSITIVYLIVYSGTDKRKHQSSASLAFVWGIHRGPVNSPNKGPVTRKMFPFDDVIMCGYPTMDLLARDIVECIISYTLDHKAQTLFVRHTRIFGKDFKGRITSVMIKTTNFGIKKLYWPHYSAFSVLKYWKVLSISWHDIMTAWLAFARKTLWLTVDYIMSNCTFC